MSVLKHLISRHFRISPTSYVNLHTMPGKRLEGKVAIVTGSTAGIGYEIAKALSENGAKTLISSRKEKNVDEAVNKLRSAGLDVSGIVCHVGKEDDRKSLIQKVIDDHGKLDILVLNAGINPVFGPLLQTPEKGWDKIFDTNVKCGFLLAKEAAPHLIKTKGSMTFVSSITAYDPQIVIGAYSVSKTALLGLVKALATELAPSDVRVNGIAPGFINTEFSKVLIETDEISKQILQTVPLNRFGTPSECAGAVVFLSSDEASYVTGETIMITGGMKARL